jgi:hypothetical protein
MFITQSSIGPEFFEMSSIYWSRVVWSCGLGVEADCKNIFKIMPPDKKFIHLTKSKYFLLNSFVTFVFNVFV